MSRGYLRHLLNDVQRLAVSLRVAVLASFDMVANFSRDGLAGSRSDHGGLLAVLEGHHIESCHELPAIEAWAGSRHGHVVVAVKDARLRNQPVVALLGPLDIFGRNDRQSNGLADQSFRLLGELGNLCDQIREIGVGDAEGGEDFDGRGFGSHGVYVP